MTKKEGIFIIKTNEKVKQKQYKIYKFSSQVFLDNQNEDRSYYIKPEHLEEAKSNGEVVSIGDTLVLDQIRRLKSKEYIFKGSNYFLEAGKKYSCKYKTRFIQDIVNIKIPQNKNVSNDIDGYRSLAINLFYVRGKKFKRLCSGTGQIRKNTITFISENLFEQIQEAMFCGLKGNEVFEKEQNNAKLNAYLGLGMSSERFLKKIPRICVVKDCKSIIPNLPIQYIETTESIIEGRKSVQKKILDKMFPDLNEPLNSFDGQGLMSIEYSKEVSQELRLGYDASQLICRAPWVKGLLTAFDWKAYAKGFEITHITDRWGTEYDINNIDVLISESQFKMYKYYDSWEDYLFYFKKYKHKFGVVMPNKRTDDDTKTLNYQYINALELNNDDIDELCKETEDYLRKITSGDLKLNIKRLKIAKNLSKDESIESQEEPEEQVYETLLQKIIKANIDFLQDEYVQRLITNEVNEMFRLAKIGKLLCSPSNYQFIISDPYAQCQHIFGHEVTGLIPKNHIYSNYWNIKQANTEDKEIVLMRSPMIDQGEVAVRTLWNDLDSAGWYEPIKSGIVLSVQDLTTLQMQNCDMDGDKVFSSNLDVLKRGAKKDAKPILYPSNSDKAILEAVTEQNLIEADIRGLNSKVGQISNKAAGFYALMAKYPKESEQYKKIEKSVKMLAENVGVEIDRVKTSIPFVKPDEWKVQQIFYKDNIVVKNGSGVIMNHKDSEAGIQSKKLHNEIANIKKPYYFRYIYPALGKEISGYDVLMNKYAKYTLGIQLKVLKDKVELTEEEQEFMDRYYSRYPLIDAPCAMNIICKKFEALHRECKFKLSGSKMLLEYANTYNLDEIRLQEFVKLYKRYIKQKALLSKPNVFESYAMSAKEKQTHVRTHLDELHEVLKSEINTMGLSISEQFNYLVAVIIKQNCDENFVFDMLGNEILQIIAKENRFDNFQRNKKSKGNS